LVPTSTLLQSLQIITEWTVLVITTVSEDPAVTLTIQNPASPKMPSDDVAGHKNNAFSDLTVNSAMPVMP